MAGATHPAKDPLPPCTARLALSWVLGRHKRYRIAGRSMWPTLREGQTVLMRRRAAGSPDPRPGDVIMVRHPQRPSLVTVKRLASIDANGAMVLGDNADESTDSRTYGPVPLTNILGRVDCTFP